MDKTKILMGFMIIMIIGTFIFAYYKLGFIDGKCLENVGKSFCENLNMSFSPMGGMTTDFTCYTSNDREYYEKEYNYLKSEEESCITKDKNTFMNKEKN